MIWALNNDIRVLAEPKLSAKCPLCKEEMIPKCGDINVWHWAHKNISDCDSWSEGETEWHINWKNVFPKENQEVIIGSHRADIRTNSRWIIELQNSPISSEKIIEREKYYKRMVWLINGFELAKGLDLRIKKDFTSFRWKNPSKSWWSSEKEIYVDITEYVENLKYYLKRYSEGTLKKNKPIYGGVYYEYYTPEAEHIEVSYPCIEDYYDNTENEIKLLKEKINLFEGKLFLIKNIYKDIPCGGWGQLISKEDFINKFS